MVKFSGHEFGTASFWIVVLAGVSLIAGIVMLLAYYLGPIRRRARMAAASRDVIRRDVDRMTQYLDGLSSSADAVRQPFELGLAAIEDNAWDKAVGCFQQAMPEAKGAQLVALFNLTGVCRYAQGMLDAALSSFEQASRLAEQFGAEDGKAPAFGNIGVVRHDRGELDVALQYKEKALAQAHQLGDQWAEAIYLANIGNIWRDKGELDRALEYHQQALELSRALGDKWGVASDLAGIAGIYRDQGSLDEALRLNKEALAIARKLGHRLGVVTSLGGMASIYRLKGRDAEALKYGEESLGLARRIGYQLGVAADLGNIGLILVAQGKCSEAAPKLAEALALMLASGVADGPRQVVTGLVRCEDNLGRRTVEDLLKQAGLDGRTASDLLDRVDQIRRKKPRPKSKSTSRV
ncbi:tetratricopeptide repeat protein [candidate division WOR-3 bacterium]|uniref:Tetratricopeptide repeat protein n=1 Tax=candidate division WOR-3 bacterium TaxID=2052148 RepID=A0A937XFT9_UNCW3|nr:tetratricopeptide repeat protein [candidate division WOR-3 bacterium]